MFQCTRHVRYDALLPMNSSRYYDNCRFQDRQDNASTRYESLYRARAAQGYLGMPSHEEGKNKLLLYLQSYCNATLFYSIPFHSILSYPILSYPILSYPILSYPILSYPILSYPLSTLLYCTLRLMRIIFVLSHTKTYRQNHVE
jgi:hypothetical protein